MFSKSVLYSVLVYLCWHIDPCKVVLQSMVALENGKERPYTLEVHYMFLTLNSIISCILSYLHPLPLW